MEGTFPLRAVLLRVKTAMKGNTIAAGRNEQAHHETMTRAASTLVAVVAPPLAGSPPSIAATEGVFGFLSLMPDQRLIHEEQPLAAATRLEVEHHADQVLMRIGGSQIGASQKPRDRGPMTRLGTETPRSFRGRHPPATYQERREHADGEAPRLFVPAGRFHKPLDSWQRIPQDNHGGAPSSLAMKTIRGTRRCRQRPQEVVSPFSFPLSPRTCPPARNFKTCASG